MYAIKVKYFPFLKVHKFGTKNLILHELMKKNDEERNKTYSITFGKEN
jgi:hypothetical protein